MLVYVVTLPLIVILGAVVMLWPTHLLPLWTMYRAGVFNWADAQGITTPRLGIIASGAAVMIATVVAFYVLLFVTMNPLAVVATWGTLAGGPALGLALLAHRSLTVPVWVWFNDGSEHGGRITSRQPMQDWYDADASVYMPTDSGETIWLHAPDSTPKDHLVDPSKWQKWKAPDFLTTAGQDASLFFARCDTSPIARAARRRNKSGVKAETIRASIILAFAGLFGLLGFLGMTASTTATP